jgi:hypothetical protein
MREMKNAYILVGTPQWKKHLGDQDVDNRIDLILKWILKQQDMDWIQLAQDRVQ